MKKRQQKKNLKKLIKALGEIGNLAGEAEKRFIRMAEEISEAAERILERVVAEDDGYEDRKRDAKAHLAAAREEDGDEQAIK